MTKNQKKRVSNPGIFIKKFAAYLQLFIIPPFLQPLIVRFKRILYCLNRLYSKFIHKDRSTTIVNFHLSGSDLFFSGEPVFETYLEDRFRGMGFEEIKKSRRIDSKNDKIDILKVNRLFQNEYRNKGYLIAPDWVRAVLPLDKNDIMANFNRSAKRSLKELEENNFSYFIIQASKILERFYEEFYKPYIKSIYGESGIIKDYSVLKLFARKSYIINIKCESQTAALVFVIPAKNSWLHVYAAGLREDLPGDLKEISQAAIYNYSIEIAKAHKFNRVDFGLNRGFLNDGILNYKRKWGCSFIKPEESVYDIAFRANSSMVKALLDSNPLLINDDRDISCLFYYRNKKPTLKDIERSERKWRNCGAINYYFISPAGFDFKMEGDLASRANIKFINSDLEDFLSGFS